MPRSFSKDGESCGKEIRGKDSVTVEGGRRGKEEEEGRRKKREGGRRGSQEKVIKKEGERGGGGGGGGLICYRIRAKEWRMERTRMEASV
jgi:hypothetical protein